MSTLNTTLLWCVFQVTVVALLTALISIRPWRVGGSASPFFGLCAIAAITLTSIFPLQPWWTLESAMELVASPSKVVIERAEPSTGEVSSDANPVQDASERSRLNSAARMSPIEFANLFFDELKSVSNASERWSPLARFRWIISVIFGIGLSIGFVRFAMGIVGTQQLRHRSQPISDVRLSEILEDLRANLGVAQKVALRQTHELTTAATLGAWHPIILLPTHWNTWTEEELKAVVAHELAHVKNKDFAAQLLAQIGLALHFYNPCVHFLSNRLRLEQELAADTLAAGVSGGQRHYAKLLAKLALDHQNQSVNLLARAFLPTRFTFLRRLEMLRNSKATAIRRGLYGKLLALVLIATASLALVGIKQPGSQLMAQTPSSSPQSQVPYDLRYFSDEGGVVIALRPADLLKEQRLSILKKTFEDVPFVSKMSKSLGIEIEDVEQLLVNVEISTSKPSQRINAFLRSTKPIQAPMGGTEIRIGDHKIIEFPNGECIWQPDPKSLVLNSKRNIQRFVENRSVERSMLQTPLWNKLKDSPALVMLDGNAAREASEPMRRENQRGPNPFALLLPLVDEVKVCGVSVSTQSKLSISALVQSDDQTGAKTVHETVSAGLVLLKSSIKELRLPTNDPATTQIATDLLQIGTALLGNAKLTVDDNTVLLSTSVPMESIPISPFVAAVTATRKAAQRTESVNRLKQIALAFHNLHDAYRTFPDSQTRLDPANKYPISWRVAILPFIEQAALYNEYKMDEPWDSESNLKLLSKMPAILRHPDEPEGTTNTSYVVVTGKSAIFGSSEKPVIANIHDGTSNTIMVLEAKTSIPWTKPEDLPFDADKPLPAFGGYSPEGFSAAFADGSVRFLSKSIDEKTLRALLTARGSEVIPEF